MTEKQLPSLAIRQAIAKEASTTVASVTKFILGDGVGMKPLTAHRIRAVV